MISLDKCNGSCNVLSPKRCVSKKYINFKKLNIITNKNEGKTMGNIFNGILNASPIVSTCNSNQKWNNKTCQCEFKNYCTCKKRL